VELPSGKILARTEWRLHDHARYLWNLGEGRFLLRDGETLSTFAPLADLGAKDPFRRMSFPHRAGVVQAVVVSQDSKLVTVETSAAAAKEKTEATAPAVQPPAAQPAALRSRPSFVGQQPAGASGAAAVVVTPTRAAPQEAPAEKKPPVLLDFYRLSGAGTAADPIVLERAGGVRAAVPVSVPVDADGYLDAREPNRGTQWPVTFTTYSGERVDLAPVDSSCPPSLLLAGPSVALAVSCRGISGRMMLMALDFARHEMWEESFDQSAVPPVFTYAPSAARFALGRINAAVVGSEFGETWDHSATEEVRVYQMQTGDLLLKLGATPVYRTLENFDMSGDGMRLAVVRGGAVEIYKLPGLSKSDRDDLAVLGKLAPPAGSGPVKLGGLESAAAGAAGSQPVSAAPGAAAPDAAPAAAASGDTEGRRKPPTLLSPGEKPE